MMMMMMVLLGLGRHSLSGCPLLPVNFTSARRGGRRNLLLHAPPRRLGSLGALLAARTSLWLAARLILRGTTVTTRRKIVRALLLLRTGRGQPVHQRLEHVLDFCQPLVHPLYLQL